MGCGNVGKGGAVRAEGSGGLGGEVQRADDLCGLGALEGVLRPEAVVIALQNADGGEDLHRLQIPDLIPVGVVLGRDSGGEHGRCHCQRQCQSQKFLHRVFCLLVNLDGSAVRRSDFSNMEAECKDFAGNRNERETGRVLAVEIPLLLRGKGKLRKGGRADAKRVGRKLRKSFSGGGTTCLIRPIYTPSVFRQEKNAPKGAFWVILR